ncbi:MAG: hypothetical protein KBA55_02455 [Ruminococcus sp.]|nr:hypothetical protein [Ruminococcus sp.]
MKGFPPVFLDTVLDCDGGIILGKSIIAMTAANYAKGKPKKGGEKENRSKSRHFSPLPLVFPSALPILNLPPLCRLLLFMVRLKCLSVRPYSTAILQLCRLSHMKKVKGGKG